MKEFKSARLLVLARERAFTLIELLVVIAIIAILAAMLMPALSAAKMQSQGSYCINSFKQLGYGFMMYIGENADYFPSVAGEPQGWHPEDWIYWRIPGTDTSYGGMSNPPVSQSPIVAMMGTGTSTNIFRCPADVSDELRNQAAAEYGPIGPFPYSYTFNGTAAGAGMGLIFSGPGTTATASYFRQPSIMRPADKIMLAEEPDDDAERPPGNTRTELEDGRWLPKAPNNGTWNGKTVGLRHSKSTGNVNFADGHAQSIPWQWTSNTYYFDPTNN